MLKGVGPNFQLTGRPYNPTTKTTYKDTIGYINDNEDGPIDDDEDMCMRIRYYPHGVDMLWTNGTADNDDWANPGKNFGKPNSSN